MKANQWICGAALAVLSLLEIASVPAAEPTLKIGSPAPKLLTGQWIQGEPVKAFDKDKVYIIEFWATWCGPCKTSIPHLNEIYTKFKDKGLVVIGQDYLEQDESVVRKFVKGMGDKMTYSVAMDDMSGGENGRMAETWMDAAGQDGIPTAFVVDKSGVIAWIGHPMELTDKLIEDVLAGKFDVKKAAADSEAQRKNLAQAQVLTAELSQAVQRKDWTEASAKLDQIAKLLPEGHQAGVDMTRFRILAAKGDYDAAFKVAARISDQNENNPGLQSALAWDIATDSSFEKRDLDLAEKIAMRANKAADGKDPEALDTLARVQFVNNKKADAIATQQKAIDVADDNVKPALQKILDSYKRGELPKVD